MTNADKPKPPRKKTGSEKPPKKVIREEWTRRPNPDRAPAEIKETLPDVQTKKKKK